MCRDGSACMSYHLNKDEEKGSHTEEWIPYRPMEFEKEDMSMRQTQLQMRIEECKKTLDLLHTLNDGIALEHLIHSTIDLINLKVCKCFPIFFLFPIKCGDILKYNHRVAWI